MFDDGMRSFFLFGLSFQEEKNDKILCDILKFTIYIFFIIILCILKFKLIMPCLMPEFDFLRTFHFFRRKNKRAAEFNLISLALYLMSKEQFCVGQ